MAWSSGLAVAETPTAPASTPKIYSISPTSSPVGGEFRIVGLGFLATNTVSFGKSSIDNVPVAWQGAISCVQGNSACHPGISQALTVTVPSRTRSGTYKVSIRNSNGVSNAVAFKVTR